jgi:uridylate kinase
MWALAPWLGSWPNRRGGCAAVAGSRGSERRWQAGNIKVATMGSSSGLRYRRLLLKLSGEALMGKSGYGIDVPVVQRLSGEIRDAIAAGAEIAVVVGGGNIFRGLAGAASGMDRATADYMGMLATVMNSLALHNALEQQGIPARVLSAIPMPTICEAFVRSKALHHLECKRAVIFAAGTGNPFFTTDTTAALRAVEMNCEALAKATQVDGVYSADPKQVAHAVRYDKLTYSEVLSRDLKVMDGAAIALARDNKLPVIVFSIEEHGNLLKVLRGEASATVISG